MTFKFDYTYNIYSKSFMFQPCFHPAHLDWGLSPSESKRTHSKCRNKRWKMKQRSRGVRRKDLKKKKWFKWQTAKEVQGGRKEAWPCSGNEWEWVQLRRCVSCSCCVTHCPPHLLHQSLQHVAFKVLFKRL